MRRAGSCRRGERRPRLRPALVCLAGFLSARTPLAAQRPVVATRVGGLPDVVDEGEDGFLVELGDAAGLAERLERLARDADLRRRFGEKGRERVLPRYAVPRLVDDVDALYRELLAEAGLNPPRA